MKALFFVYDRYAEFEVNLAGMFLKFYGAEIVTVANKPLGEFVTGESGFRTVAHVELAEVNPSEYDALIFPGGQAYEHLFDENLKALTRAFAEQGKLVAGICGGTAFLTDAGLLGGKRFVCPFTEPHEQEQWGPLFPWDTHQPGEDIVVDGNIMTAREGSVFVEFACALTKYFNLFKEEADERESLLYFKNQLVKQ